MQVDGLYGRINNQNCMRTLLLLDGDGVAWSCFHAMPKLSHDEVDTAVIYGFMNTLTFLQERECANALVFAWDSKRNKRKKMFPGYKGTREKKRQEYTPEEKMLHKSRQNQFKLLRTEVLPKLGFSNIFFQSGREGDDVIARVVEKYSHKYRIKIIGRDNDMYQLLNHNTVMYDWVSQQLMDENWLMQKHGVTPDQWREVKAIAGCQGDDVPGIPGVANGYAIKYLLGKLNPTTKTYQKIAKGSKTIKFTRKLTTLPLKGTKHFTLEKDNCTVKKLRQVAKEYGFNSYLSTSRQNDWREYFCERTQNNRRQKA